MKYNIEGNIDFYDELYKSLDENNTNDTGDLCLISNLPLKDNFVTLNCKHNFNYDALYKEIYNQKIKMKTYNFYGDNLSKTEKQIIMNSGKNYFIKCPYCRNIQFDLLPDLENEELYPKVYGINTTNRAYIKYVEDIRQQRGFMHKGYFYDMFLTHQCSFKTCDNVICAFEPKFNMYCCKRHMEGQIRKKKREMREDKIKKIKEEKQRVKEEKKLLKKSTSKKAKNSVITNVGEIGEYVPENEPHKGCTSILKTGSNKGNMCGAKIFMDECCKRHYKPDDKVKEKNKAALSLVDMEELEKVINLDFDEKINV